MVSVTISVSEDVKELMKRFSEVNWSGLVRKCIVEKANKLKLREELLGDLDSERDFTEWSVELGKKAKEGRLKKLKR